MVNKILNNIGTFAIISGVLIIAWLTGNWVIFSWSIVLGIILFLITLDFPIK